MSRALATAFLAAVTLLAGTPARADIPGAHPAYLHALTDLRTARWELRKKAGDPSMKWDEANAIGEIDQAIGEIKKAAIDDGKDLENHPPENAGNLPRGARLHDALRLLEKSHQALNKEEDNVFANGLQHRALMHIDAAIDFTRKGIHAAENRE